MATEITAAPLGVYKAINAIQAELAKEGITKNRRNQQQGYNFRGIDDCYNALSPLLAQHGLCIMPRILSRTCEERPSKSGGSLFYVTVEAEFDFVCTADGSKHTCRTFGEAMDSADKATNKAMSAAYKYVVMQAFAIPTEGDNDADAHTPETAPKSQAQPPKQANGNGAPKQAEIPPAPAENPDKAIALTVFGEVVALAESMGYTKTEVGDMYKTVYNAKTAGTVSHATAIDIKRDMAAKAALWPQIRDAVLATYFDPQTFDPTLDREKALLVDKTRDVLADKASLEYASKPLRAKAGVWQEWKTELSQKATAAA